MWLPCFWDLGVRMAGSEKLRALKMLVGAMQSPILRECYKCDTVPDGVPKGAIIELLGPQKTAWLLEFLKQNDSGKIFWAERDQSVLPTAIHQRGVDLRRITFGLLGEQPTISLRRVIQSQLYPFVIAPNSFSEIRVFKAFQLLTEKSRVSLFLIGGKQACSAWPIAMQLEIRRSQHELKVSVLRNKRGAVL
jgi:hypothetical protein